ncbi:MAG: 30S ribosome-binding factor RbfA [Clostridia bacterium]|nr:30S ribosome-binding factor RbfA [Clostridia bacterium]
MNNKTVRANSEIQKKLSEIILYHLKDPRFTDVMSITKVNVSPDFTHCKAFVSVFNADKNRRNQTIKLLNKSAGFIKHMLADSLELRAIPELVFFLDDGYYYAEQVDKILNDLNETKNN